jgi:hypothetical protein
MDPNIVFRLTAPARRWGRTRLRFIFQRWADEAAGTKVTAAVKRFKPA